MSSDLDQLTADAMKLPLRDRVQLAQRLVATLDDEVENGAEELCFAEAERGLENFAAGQFKALVLMRHSELPVKLASDESRFPCLSAC